MKAMLFSLLIICIITVLMGCETGYTRKLGDWVWVTNDDQHGKRSNIIAEADEATFEVMDNEQFAKDKNNVYYQGKKVNHVKASKVQFLGGSKSYYFKDDKYAYCTSEVILNADPATFEVIEFPYSRDKKDVYCGTVPMMLTNEEMKSFKVTNEDKWTKNTISTTMKLHFIEYNPKYAWIDTLGIEIEKIVTGDWGTAEAAGKKFIGLREVKTGTKL
jgi:hypothetical protein